MEEKKGLLAGVGKVVGGVGKVIGGGLKAIGKGVTSVVGVFSPGAENWLNTTASNMIGSVKNGIDSFKNQADLGQISVLKKQLTNMLIQFAFAFKRQLVNEAKENGKEIAETKDNIGKGKESVLSGKVNAEDVAKNMKTAANKDKDLSTGKSVSDLLDNAKAKSAAINKTNQDLGMSGMTAPTKGMGRN